MDFTPDHIAIIGAGIGGLALAIGCLRNNVPYILYEAAGQYAAIGAGVGFGPNSLRAMDLLDPELRVLYNEIKTGNLTPGKERTMAELLMTEPGFGARRGWTNGEYGGLDYERTSAHRQALLQIMTSRIPAETVKFNKKLAHLEQVSDGVILTFADGEVVKASAAVGSDGIKGITRKFVVPTEHVEPTYTHKYAYRAIIPMEDAQRIMGEMAGDSKMFVGPGHNMLTYPISRGKELNLVAFKSHPHPWLHKELTHTVTKEEMLADFENVDTRLLQLLDYAKPTQWSIWHHLNTPTYFNNRICLLGDVAHAMTPHQAQGAGQCIEDAYVLSRLLGRTSLDEAKTITAAFKAYDAVRRPRVQEVVRTSQECGEVYFLRGPMGEDMEKIFENLKMRFEWIWDHDLEGDVERAEGVMEKSIKEGV